MKEFIKIFAVKGATTKHYLIGAWIAINIMFCTGINENTPWFMVLIILASFAASVYVSNKVDFPDDEEEE